jgi:hypothetical protein
MEKEMGEICSTKRMICKMCTIYWQQNPLARPRNRSGDNNRVEIKGVYELNWIHLVQIIIIVFV